MLKVVEIKFACEEEFNAKLEVQNALADHLNQVLELNETDNELTKSYNLSLA